VEVIKGMKGTKGMQMKFLRKLIELALRMRQFACRPKFLKL
jgi:hypothetical protein